jgi:hypothetical protein
MEIFFLKNYQELSKIISVSKKDTIVIVQVSAEYCSPCKAAYAHMEKNFKIWSKDFFEKNPKDFNLVYYYHDLDVSSPLISVEDEALITNIPAFFVYKYHNEQKERLNIFRKGAQSVQDKTNFENFLKDIIKIL